MYMVRIRISKSELQSQTVEVGEWEVPVLMAVHGSESVTLEKRFRAKGKEMPQTAADEMERLVRRYGADEDSGIPYANQVYGQHTPGLHNLARAMEDSQAPRGGKAPAEEADDTKQVANA